jgi:6-phosphogluconolactonase (cycloisomerase 2 family)
MPAGPPKAVLAALLALSGVTSAAAAEVRYPCRGRLRTAAQIAALRGISPADLDRLGRLRSLSPSEVCTIPQPALARALAKVGPRPDEPDEAIRHRLLSLRDENGVIPPDGLLRARQHVARMREERARGAFQSRAGGIEPGLWTWLGPGNIGGRLRTLLIHPTTPATMWAGSVGGGIWRTTNGGASWSPVDDFMANLAVTTLVLLPGDPNVLYAGTGEGFLNSDSIRGAGIFKSIDGGTTWAQLPSTANSGFFFVNRLAMSPDGATLLAATGTGLYRSTTGGTSWTQVTGTRTLDVDFHPSDPLRAVAGRGDGIASFSLDGGATWTEAPSVGGLRVEVAYARSNPGIVYASVEVSSGQLHRSVDGGQSYTLVNTGTNYLGSQGWYDNALWVDPTNPDIVIVGGIDLWRSTNGGGAFTKISQWFSAPNSAHADHHLVVAHPGFNGTTNTTVYFANDGGVYRANNVYTVSLTSGWQELNNNLGVTQFYGAAGHPATGTIVGGTQDNGTLRYRTSTGSEGWTTMFGGDGGWCASDPTDPNYFYGEYVRLQIHRSTNGGASSSYIFNGITDAGSCANFIAPFILDPNDPDTMLGGGCQLWRSTNVKAPTPTWTSIKPALGGTARVSAIAVAQGNPDLVWVGHNNGDVYVTTNGTAGAPTWTLVGPSLPNRVVTRLAIDATDHDRVYATFGGFSEDNVWRTDDGGGNWTDATGSGGTGLPAAPVRSLVINPANPAWIYVGTEVGTFASEDRGATWAVPHDGPANVSVDELFWMDTTLVAATHGRGLFSVPVAMGPTLSVGDLTVTEGTGGTVNAVFTITLSAPQAAPVTVDFATADGTATAPADYATTSGTRTFPAGTVTQTVSVSIVTDGQPETAETFLLNLSVPSGADIADGQGVATIADDDRPVISVGDLVVPEGDEGPAAAGVTVSLSQGVPFTVTVDYATANGTAGPGDYVPASGTLTFPPNTSTAVLPLSVLGDTAAEGDETFTVNLSGAANATIGDSQATVTILDDDGAAGQAVSFVYAAEVTFGRIAGFTVGPQTGSLAPVPGEQAQFVASGLALDPSGRHLYAGSSSGSVRLYLVNPSTGEFSPFAFGSIGGLGLSHVALHPSGRFLYVVNSTAATVIVSVVDPVTGLTTTAGTPFPTAGGPRFATVDVSGRFLYVTGDTPVITAFRIDLDSGALTPVPGSPFAAGTVPLFTLATEPTGRHLYATQWSTGLVRGYAIDASTGALAPIPGSPFAALGNPVGMAVHPNGRFLYTTNTSGQDNVRGFHVHASTGALTPFAGAPVATGAVPQNMVIDLGGRYAYVSNLDSDNLSGYSIDAATGALTPLPGSPFAPGGGRLVTGRSFVRGDFSRNGRTDILWRHDGSGQNVLWYMNGAELSAGEFTEPPVLPDVRWKMVGTHDFNGDRQSDILWRHEESGENVLWRMNGRTLVGGEFLTPSALADNDWKMAGTGDFNGDGRPDIAWHHRVSGQIVLWYMNGSVLQGGTFTTPPALPDTGWKMVGVADFSGDNRPDLLWRHDVSGENVVWRMADSVLVSGTFTNPPALADTDWRIVAVGDYNLDRRNDIVWRHSVSGQNAIWYMNGVDLIGGTFTTPAVLADPGWKMVGPR